MKQSRQDPSTAEKPLPHGDTPRKSRRLPANTVISAIRWWLPEILCSVVSILSFISTVIVAHVYNGKNSQDLGLPDGLSLNGLISILSTINRAALMVPVGSVMSQELWLWLSSKRRRKGHHALLGDLEKSDAASRGAWGSLVFLLRPNGRYLKTRSHVVKLRMLNNCFGVQVACLSRCSRHDPRVGIQHLQSAAGRLRYFSRRRRHAPTGDRATYRVLRSV